MLVDDLEQYVHTRMMWTVLLVDKSGNKIVALKKATKIHLYSGVLGFWIVVWGLLANVCIAESSVKYLFTATATLSNCILPQLF